MAELDKRSERAGEASEAGEAGEVDGAGGEPPAEDEDDEPAELGAPRRHRKPDKGRSKDRHNKKNPAKVVAGTNASGDGARLRSSR